MSNDRANKVWSDLSVPSARTEPPRGQDCRVQLPADPVTTRGREPDRGTVYVRAGEPDG